MGLMFYKSHSMRDAKENASQWEDMRMENRRGYSNHGFGLELMDFEASNVDFISKFFREFNDTQ